MYLSDNINKLQFIKNSSTFLSRCEKSTYKTQARIKCLTSQKVTQSYVMVSECPNSWKDTVVEKQCKSENSTDPLIYIPVYDYKTSLTFANVFCALCNGARNYSYWNVGSFASSRNLSDNLNYAKSWKTVPNPPQSAQFCISSPTLSSAPTVVSNSISRTLLWSYCKSYSLPLRNCMKIEKVKNPHCGLLFSNEIATRYFCKCKYMCNCNIFGSPARPFSLLFSFQSKVTSSSSQNPSPKHVVIKYFCRQGEVYDPFHSRCRRLFQPLQQTMVTTSNETFVNRSLPFGREYNKTEQCLHNLSSNRVIPQIQIEANHTGNGTYFICVNIQPPSVRHLSQSSNVILSWLTLIGLLISITASLLFLLSNALFSELRTFFGKNLISLVVSLLLLQTTFLLAGQTEIPTVCNVITALLHFSVLSVFSWMSVLAFDLCRTFSSKGKSFSFRVKRV